MSKSQRPTVRTSTVLLIVIALGEIGLWFFLEPTGTLAQQVVTPTAASVTPVTNTIINSPSPVTSTSVISTPNASAPRATPTPRITVITPTAQPVDVFTAATQSVRLTERAQREGTPTPLPPNFRIATRTPTAPVVTATPTAANSATATNHAMHATAIAFTTGTPNVRVATFTSTPIPTPTAFIITPTPRPANVFEEATRKAGQELQAQRGETPTALPRNVIVATVTQTPRVVTNTPPPANDATATVYALHATAVAYTTGVPNVVTATPTISPTPRPASQTPSIQTPQATSSGVSQTNTPEPVTALAAQSSPAQSPTVVQTSTPASVPASTLAATSTELPTPLAAEALEFEPVPEWTRTRRIRFARGATHAIVGGYVDDENPARFVLKARSGQSMTVFLQNEGGHLARVEISTVKGDVLGSAYAGEIWSDVLPATQLYFLTIGVPKGGTAHDFSLWVEILP